MAIDQSFSDNLKNQLLTLSPMQKICFLSTDNLEDFYVWDDSIDPTF